MFTGLIEDIGVLADVVPEGMGVALTVRTAIPLHEVRVGDSIAIDGACLTATRIVGDQFTVIAARETMERTTLRGARAGRRVHLERARRLGDRLDGHLVQGHVDGVGRYDRVEQQAESRVLWVALPEELRRYVAAKGSICLDGVSLTVNELVGGRARVNAVPHTQTVTRLGEVRAGDSVNIEVDVLAKYVESLLGRHASSSGLDLETLRTNGFM